MLRRRTKMLFKLGLTCIVTVAIVVYYYIDKTKDKVTSVKDDKAAVMNQDNTGTERHAVASSKGDNLIHLCVVVCKDRKEEAITMIKSAILWPRKKLRIHIFAEEELQQPIRNKFALMADEFRNKFDYVFYPITFPSDKWKQLFKPCSSQRLFLPGLLNDIDAVIYVDTDVILLRPIDDLWAHFGDFNTSHIAALAPESEDIATGWYNRFATHPFFGLTGVNSGVMLMNLTRMRTFGWIKHVLDYYREFRLRLTWGDQDLINILFHFHPDKLYVYTCEWNYRPDHCMYMSVCEIAEHEGISVLHGNRGVLHSNTQPAFKVIFDAFHNHRLGADVQYSLLEEMTKNLENTVNTNCGQVRQIFTKQFEKQIPEYRRRKMEWLRKNQHKILAVNKKDRTLYGINNEKYVDSNITLATSFIDFVQGKSTKPKT